MDIAQDAESDLAMALPALKVALKEVEKLDRSAITEIKAYLNPPVAVEKVVSCVMILLGKPTDWISAKKVLGETNFVLNLKNFDKEKIKESVLRLIKKYVCDEADEES